MRIGISAQITAIKIYAISLANYRYRITCKEAACLFISKPETDHPIQAKSASYIAIQLYA